MTDGPILELAVGSGRIAVPLAAAAGHRVTGVDSIRAMLVGRGARAGGRGERRRPLTWSRRTWSTLRLPDGAVGSTSRSSP